MRRGSDLKVAKAKDFNIPFLCRVEALRAFFFLVPFLTIATGSRVATFTRTTLPFHKVPTTTPTRTFPHRDDTAEERSMVF